MRVLQDESCLGLLGDLNGDSIINILDVIILVNIILGSNGNQSMGDMNGDGVINILDVILLVGIILGD